MNEKLKITFLSDSPDNWMDSHLEKLINNFQNKYEVSLIYDEKEIPTGDILFILSFYKLIPESFLKLNKNNIVIHASALPKGKGWSPATWQILEGKNEIPLTMFEAVKETDAGDIYLQKILKLDGTELIEEWQNKMGEMIFEMIKEFIEKYPNNEAKKQADKESFYPRRTPEDSELDINKTISEQFNLFRVADNEKYPAFFKIKGKKYFLKISN